MKKTILIPALIWVFAVSLSAQNYNKDNNSQSEKFKKALQEEIKSAVNDVDNVERVLVEIRNYESVTSFKVVSASEWSYFQNEISTLENSLQNISDENDKKSTQEKIAFLKTKLVKLSDIKSQLSTLKN